MKKRKKVMVADKAERRKNVTDGVTGKKRPNVTRFRVTFLDEKGKM